MTKTHKLFVSVGLILFVLASVYATIGGSEVFPILRYPMYSAVREVGDMMYDFVYAVPVDDLPEFRLDAPAMIAPFDRLRLRTALKRLPPDARPAALSAVLTRYEQARQAGEHDGPPLSALRLYRDTWYNFGTDFVPDTPPDSHRLLLEVRK